MSDAFSSTARTPNDPAITVFDIVPNDGVDLPQTTLSLNVGSPGTVRVTMIDGSIGDVKIHPGQAFAMRVRCFWQTGTSATGISGLA